MFPKVRKIRDVYLDYAAATPLHPHVAKAMAPFLEKKFANPSSLHRQGREAAAAIAEARQAVSDAIGARPGEVIFTAGGTESINLAVRGVIHCAHGIKGKRPHIITTQIEHEAVLEVCKSLEQEGVCRVTYLKVDTQGILNLKELEAAVRPETCLVSVMYANNEIGTIEPITKIGKLLAFINTKRAAKKMPRIVFHTDACQAVGALDLYVDRLGVDLLSVNGSKIYGPKGSGFLYVRSGISLKPFIYGGGQERGLRSGTENVAGIVGLALALKLSAENRVKEAQRLTSLRNYFISKIKRQIKGILLNGTEDSTLKVYRAKGREVPAICNRLPNNINITVPGVEGETLMLYLDSYGIAVSTKSACVTASNEPSHVLKAIGRSTKQALSSIRMTLGAYTTKADVDYVLNILVGVVSQLRQIKNDL